MRIHGHNTGSIAALAARLQDVDLDLRWGGQQVPRAINGTIHLLDGLEQLQAFEAAGVPSVPFTLRLPEALDWVEDGSVVFARKRNHTQGRDIITFGEHTLITAALTRRLTAADFYTRFAASTAEWRIHIFQGQSIARAKKVYTAAGAPALYPIRSRRLGWTMEHTSEPPKDLRDLARAAAAACKYELAAVDVLQTGPKTFLALECNSRPALRDEYTLGQYVRAFRAL